MQGTKSNSIRYLIPILILIAISININAHSFINFYDENSLTLIPTVTITDSNGSTYTSDVNGLWSASLTGAKSFDISKTGYATRPFDFNFTADANYNFLLNPSSLDSNIDFTVRDTSNNLWTSRYLIFNKNSDSNFPHKTIIAETRIDSNSTEINDTGSGYVLRKTFNYSPNRYISKVTDQIKSADAGTRYVKVKYYYADSNTYESINSIAGAVYTAKTYTNILPNNTVTKIEVYLNAVSGTVYEKDTNVYSDGNVSLYNSVVNSILTSSTGTATASIKPSGDYNALLYDTNGTLNTTYQKTTVTVNKPLNEKTLAAISPYDIYVGGNLNYSLTNQSSATQAINIFGGTTSTYDFSVIDYNAVPADRKFVQRTYSINNPWGSSYSTTYTLQPYLLLLTDAVIPTVYVLDVIKRPIENVLIEVYKSVSGTNLLLERKLTDSAGQMSYSAYPLDIYTLKLYYEGVLKGTYSREAKEDSTYFILNLYSDLNFGYSPEITMDWDMNNIYDVSTEDVIALGTLTLSSAETNKAFTTYTVSVNQGGATLATSTTATTGTHIDLNHTFAKALFDGNIGYANIVLTATYTFNGTTYTQTFRNTVGINENKVNIFTVMQTVPNDLGHLWSALLAILITVAILAIITSQVAVDEVVLTVLGMLILGLFVTVGWIAAGITVLGVDILTYTYILGCGVVFYYMTLRR